MNLLYAGISQIFVEDGLRMGKIRVGGALKNIPLELLADAVRGDTILLCDDVAIGKVASDTRESRKEMNHVSGNPR